MLKESESPDISNMLGKLRLSLCILLVLAPFVASSIAFRQTKAALTEESKRLGDERAAGLATQASLTLDALFVGVDSIISSAGDTPIDPSVIGTSHPSISSVAVFEKTGFQMDRWPQGSVSPIDPPQGQGITNMRGDRILKTARTRDERTVAIVISLGKLQNAMGANGQVSLREKPSSGPLTESHTRSVAGYPLIATAERVSVRNISSPGWVALSLLGMAAYWILLRSLALKWRSRNESLAQKTRELESELKQIRSSFLSSVAKELLNPLSHVLGLTGTLAGRWEDLSDEKKRLLVDRIGANAEAMDEMVEEMMDFARIEEGTHKLFPRVCSLQMECDGVLNKLRPALRHHRAVSMVPEDLSVVADCRALRRVIEILLSNAVRFSPNGSLIMLRAHRSGDQVAISVDDEGAAIPSEDFVRVFDRYYKRDDQRSGPGVGLWIAKDFVSSMGGQIQVDTSDRGNTFTFTLPAILRADLTLPPDNVLVGGQLP